MTIRTCKNSDIPVECLPCPACKGDDVRPFFVERTGNIRLYCPDCGRKGKVVMKFEDVLNHFKANRKEERG
jgi:hypothetical protein